MLFVLKNLFMRVKKGFFALVVVYTMFVKVLRAIPFVPLKVNRFFEYFHMGSLHLLYILHYTMSR